MTATEDIYLAYHDIYIIIGNLLTVLSFKFSVATLVAY